MSYTYKASKYYRGVVEDDVGDLNGHCFFYPSSQLYFALSWLDLGLEDVDKESVGFGHCEIPI